MRSRRRVELSTDDTGGEQVHAEQLREMVFAVRGEGRDDEIGRLVRFLLSDDARWMTGSVLTADGGLAAQ